MGEKKSNWIGYGLVATGAGIGIASLADFFGKRALINDYIDESKTYRNLLLKMPENPSKQQARVIDELAEQLEEKEQMVREMGFLSQLREAVKTTFGAIVGVLVTIGVLKFFWGRYRPPGIKYVSPYDDIPFDTYDDLDNHIRDDADWVDDPEPYGDVIDALTECSSWFIEAVAAASGIAASKLKYGRAWWDGLSQTDKIIFGIAIAIAVMLCVAVAWWAIAGAGVSAAADAAVACVIV